jgi:hypothetical protein
MFHTGTGNDLQADDDFLSLYELLQPLPAEPGNHSSTTCISVPPTAHTTVAIGLSITSYHLLRDSVLLARVITLTAQKRYL